MQLKLSAYQKPKYFEIISKKERKKERNQQTKRINNVHTITQEMIIMTLVTWCVMIEMNVRGKQV